MRAFDDSELQRRVDEVLYYVWDPIGVSDEPYARGEYDGYVPQVFKLVSENDNIEPISAYLADIATTRMGLSADRKRCNYAAELLLKHKEAIKEGLA
ncbi:MAG: hypothetical protein ACYSTI_13920 [Planctomycetota bacterium]|jgi:hypothetical protein